MGVSTMRSNKSTQKANSFRANRGGTRKSGQGDNSRTLKGNTNKSIIYSSLKQGNSDMITKRLVQSGTISTGAASGVIDIGTSRASSVSGAVGFASYAARYFEHRVIAKKLTFFPVQTNTSHFAGALLASFLAISNFQGDPPTTYSEVLADEDLKLLPTVGRECASFEADAKAFPNAMLWTGTGTAIVADRDFGLAYASNPSVIIGVPLAVTQIYALFIEYIVQFKNPR
jgi:hypothetical protein